MAAMRRPALAALAAAAVTALLAVPRPAHADGTYASFGLGPGQVSDELGAYVRTTFQGRFTVGHRVGHLAIEGSIGPESSDDFNDPYGYEAVRLGLDARYVLPVVPGVQVYVRGGLTTVDATLSSSDGNRYAERDYAGRGVEGGAGVQLRGKVRALGFLYWPLFFVPVGPKIDAALFVDHSVEFDRLHAVTGPERSIDARFTRLTIGINVGADF